MLIFDFLAIGNKLCLIRKNMGMTQAEVAEAAGVCDRTYADIERGSVNMRVETLLRICKVLKITPDEILTSDTDLSSEEIMNLLNLTSGKNRKTALKILEAYLQNV